MMQPSSNIIASKRVTSILVRGLSAFAFAAALVVIWVPCFPVYAYAYVDPSVMTYTIQALAGVAVALSAVLGVVWRRVRRFIFKVLHIDENVDRRVDPPVHVLDVHASEYRDQVTKANDAARIMKHRLKHKNPIRLPWRARFFFSLLASMMLCFTIIIAGPLEIVASSSQSLYFSVNDVWVPLVTCAVVAMLVIALLLSLVRGVAFNVCFAIVAAIALAAYIQAIFLNTSLPPADGKHVAWDQYVGITALSAAIWIALIVGFIVFTLKKTILFKGVASILCIGCVIAQGIALGMIFANPPEAGLKGTNDPPIVTMDGMLDVSSKDNVIMIVLDTYDVKYLKKALQADPRALDEFTGFTCYTNTTGSMIPTYYAMASLVTGRAADVADAEWHNANLVDWYTQDNLIDDINACGYQTDLYATDIYSALDALSQRVANIHPAIRETNPEASLMVLLKCSMYRYMPWILKPSFWFYTDEINSAVLVKNENDLALTTWDCDDAMYYRLLKERGLSVKDIGEKGSYRLLHFMGAHFPYTLDRNGMRTETEHDSLEQFLGSLYITSEYLKQLKEAGVYDNATIIITADHGDWYLADDLNGPINPILFVKSAMNAEEAKQPVKFSSVPTGHLDLATTILTAMGGDSSKYNGMNIPEIGDEARTRYFNSTKVDMDKVEWEAIVQWKIEGDALDWNNWTKTGKEWPIK